MTLGAATPVQGAAVEDQKEMQTTPEARLGQVGVSVGEGNAAVDSGADGACKDFRARKLAAGRGAFEVGAFSEPVKQGLPQSGAREVPAARGLCFNRWLLFGVYCAICLFTGPGFFNWTAVADVLQLGGIYAWLCVSSGAAAAPASGVCAEQELALDGLFGVMSSSAFICSFLAGLSLDLFGPKVTGVLGVGVAASGWALLASVSPTFDAGVAASVLIGAGVDMAFFPCLGLATLFSGSAAAVIGVLGACRSLSFVVPLVFRVAAVDAQVASPRAVLLGFAAGGLGLCLLADALFLPWKPWTKELSGASTAAGGDGAAEAKGRARCDGGKEGSGSGGSSLVALQQTTSSVCNEMDSFGGTPSRAAEDTEGAAASGFCCFCLKETLQFFGAVGWKLAGKGTSLLRECLSPLYLPLLPFFAFMLINVIFFIPSAAHLMPAAYAANQVVQVFSFAPCPLLGLAADKWGVLRVMHFTNACVALAYACVLIPSIPAWTALQYVASVLLAVATSFMLSQLYCYAESNFSTENRGSLIGFVCCFAGVASLVVHPMREAALASGFQPLCFVALALCAANAASVFFLQFTKRRRKAREALAVEKERRTEGQP